MKHASPTKIILLFGAIVLFCCFLVAPSSALAANEAQISDPTDFEFLTADTAALTTITASAGGQATQLDVQSNYIDLTLDSASTLTFNVATPNRYFRIRKMSGSDDYTLNPTCPTTSVTLTGTGAQTVLRLDLLTTNSCAPSPVIVTPTSTGGGGGVTPVAPTALALGTGGVGGTALTFSINNGATQTTSSSLTLAFNADPRTVKGYAASLDPGLKNASIFPLASKVTFDLPSIPGTYTVYLRYYSITGDPSPLLTKTIVYAPAGLIPTQPLILFQRYLRLGYRGNDVKQLQQFLNARGFLLAKTGFGSPGQETTYFGPLLTKALISFQEANRDMILKPYNLLRGTGYFGPATLRFVNDLLRQGK